MSILSSGDLFTSLGGFLTGLSEILGLVGALIGYLLRQHRNQRRERLRTETAASLAVQEAKRKLEERLEQQHRATLQVLRDQVTATSAQSEERLNEMERSYELQIRQWEQQVRDLTRDREQLLQRLLKGKEEGS